MGLDKTYLNTAYVKGYVKQNEPQAFILNTICRNEDIGKAEGDNLEGIRPRHRRTILFPSLPQSLSACG